MLKDQIDFLFIPKPTRVVTYSDHDGYVTSFAFKKGYLRPLQTILDQKGFKRVTGYQRRL